MQLRKQTFLKNERSRLKYYSFGQIFFKKNFSNIYPFFPATPVIIRWGDVILILHQTKLFFMIFFALCMFLLNFEKIDRLSDKVAWPVEMQNSPSLFIK